MGENYYFSVFLNFCTIDNNTSITLDKLGENMVLKPKKPATGGRPQSPPLGPVSSSNQGRIRFRSVQLENCLVLILHGILKNSPPPFFFNKKEKSILEKRSGERAIRFLGVFSQKHRGSLNQRQTHHMQALDSPPSKVTRGEVRGPAKRHTFVGKPDSWGVQGTHRSRKNYQFSDVAHCLEIVAAREKTTS